MKCSSNRNIDEKVKKKLLKSISNWAMYNMKERRPGHRVKIIPIVIKCVRGGVNRLKEQIARALGTD